MANVSKSGIQMLREAAGEGLAQSIRARLGDRVEVEQWHRVPGSRIDAIADRIEREHLEQVNALKETICSQSREIDELRAELAARRELTDEAREAVERLRALDANCAWSEVFAAVGKCTYPSFQSFSDRLKNLIEYGGQEVVEGYRRTLVKIGCMLGYEEGELPVLPELLIGELDKRLMPDGMQWPRFEDGEKVAYRCQIDHDGKTETVQAVYFYNPEHGCQLSLVGRDHELLHFVRSGEHIKRPKPEVLGADGLPIRKGETVWDTTSPNDATASTAWQHGGPLVVIGYSHERDCAICQNDRGVVVDCLASELTHTPPVTQERINELARKRTCDYFGDPDYDCAECEHEPSECRDEMILDLLRLQRELDARTMGGAR